METSTTAAVAATSIVLSGSLGVQFAVAVLGNDYSCTSAELALVRLGVLEYTSTQAVLSPG